MIALTVLALYACDRVTPSPDAPLPAPVPAGVALVVDEATGSVSVRTGQTFAVTLSSNFDWQVQTLPDGLELLGTKTGPTTTAQRDGGETGGASWFVFHLKAVQPGEGELVLTEAPGWEPEKPMRTLAIPVRVEP
ncbi:protease inhibitor I42 family protein [Brevundimonas poindexterae]|uniref:protease inhibitor I42 family protein n=1 Tax=Brevundimonas poindexterae TaxID=74325 RepID=UPI001CFD8E00|nr:protease inhibitor I42 family protein [Brevundimonas poindexterae]